VISIDEIKALATMPGKEELFSKLLFLIQSPAQRLATVINATGRDLAVVINQGVEKGKFAGSAAPAAEAAAPAAAAPAAEVEAAHAEEASAGEQPSGAAQPENATATQSGEAAGTDPVEG